MKYRPIVFYDLLPRGMKYPSHHLTSRAERDKLIFAKLAKSGIIGYGINRYVYSNKLNTALAAMFAAAAKDEVRAKLVKTTKEDKDTDGDKDEGDYLDFVDEVKRHAEWADHMSSSLFLDFFHALLGARVAWNESEKAKLDIQFYKLAGGFDEDEDEEIDDAAAAAAAAAAGAAIADGEGEMVVKPETALEGEKVEQKVSTDVNKMALEFLLN
ncbi:hypothetical protein PG984_012433 [Apiospora sp. TS-2023a]